MSDCAETNHYDAVTNFNEIMSLPEKKRENELVHLVLSLQFTIDDTTYHKNLSGGFCYISFSFYSAFQKLQFIDSTESALIKYKMFKAVKIDHLWS